jgi:hypothetical protein
MSKSEYARNAVLNACFNNTAFQVAIPWVSLHSADPGLTGASELSGNNYGRVNASASFPNADAGALSNNAEIAFPEGNGAWTQATYFGVWDAETDGNFIRGGALTTPRTGGAGIVLRFAVGDLDTSET